MILETIESEGLAHLSYLLGDEDAGIAAVIDPRRDVDIYLECARRQGVRITHIVETHLHADFVSGSRELAAQTGAPIFTGPGAEYRFEHQTLQEGDALRLGELCLEALCTPGHTPEHLSLLVSGGRGAGSAWGLFTGDTLFAGEVGRPDLLGGDTAEPLARQLFHSLHQKILKLEDGIEIYPAHGEGSPCGARIGARPRSTIGYERRHNPRLQTNDEEQFVHELLQSQPPAPAYYARMKQMNAEGPLVLGCLPEIPSLDAVQFEAAMEQPEAVVLDARPTEAFGGAHIPGAVNIGLREAFAIWAGWLLRPEQRLLLVLPDAQALDTVRRHLLRVGLEHVAGFLRHGFRAWIEAGEPFATIAQMSVHELCDHVCDHRLGELQVLDVRRDDEWAQGHIHTAKHIYLPELPRRLSELDRSRPVAVYCSTGYRAGIAASLLQREGFRDVIHVPGSMIAWRAANLPLENGE